MWDYISADISDIISFNNFCFVVVVVVVIVLFFCFLHFINVSTTSTRIVISKCYLMTSFEYESTRFAPARLYKPK